MRVLCDYQVLINFIDNANVRTWRDANEEAKVLVRLSASGVEKGEFPMSRSGHFYGPFVSNSHHIKEHILLLVNITRISLNVKDTFIVALKASLRKMTNFNINVVSDTVCRKSTLSY